LIREYSGNIELLKLKKTAFLCSRQVPAEAILKCYDWAIAQRDAGNCVISGFQSQIEQDVLHYLLKGKQPIILTVGRGLKNEIEPEFKDALFEGRLLIITPFSKDVKRVTRRTVEKRNEMIVQVADKIILGYKTKDSSLDGILAGKDYIIL
jgi:predicted Rossmann fold nucleotide-binding protein DprA/Smf involved in DNA uptake